MYSETLENAAIINFLDFLLSQDRPVFINWWECKINSKCVNIIDAVMNNSLL
jgi:hypothetical protein